MNSTAINQVVQDRNLSITLNSSPTCSTFNNDQLLQFKLNAEEQESAVIFPTSDHNTSWFIHCGHLDYNCL